MFNSIQLNPDELIDIAKKLDLLDNSLPIIDQDTNLYVYAHVIKSKLIAKLQTTYQYALANTGKIKIKNFFNSIQLSDFDDFKQLQAAEKYLIKFAAEFDNKYLEEMWRTRRERYNKLVATDSSTTLFFIEEFKPKSTKEIELNNKKFEVNEKVEYAKQLISYLVKLNKELIFSRLTRPAPAA